MKTLFKHLRPYRKECVLGPLLKLAEATLELLVPLVVAAIIDRGIGNHDRPYVVWMCLLMALLGLVGLAFSVTAQYFCAKAAVGFGARLRQALFRHIQKLSYSTLDEISTPTLVTRLTGDMNLVQTGLNLLPIYPADGGRVLSGLLSLWLTHKTVAWMTASVSMSIVVGLIAIVLYLIFRYTVDLFLLASLGVLLVKLVKTITSCKAVRLLVQ